MSNFICALSGEQADDDDLVEDSPDELDNMPIGWTRITFERRLVNPRYAMVQQAKAMLVDAALANVPEEAREQARPLVQIQLDAQFAALEAETVEFSIEREVVYVSDTDQNTLVAKEFDAVREALGLLPEEADEQEDG